MSTDASAFLPMAVAIARQAGTYLRSVFGSVGGRVEGGHFKSDADRRAHAIIAESLARAFPTHSIYSEEGNNAPDFSAPYLWVVDPLDGTTNFAHGIPLFGTFLSLLERGIPTLGVVHDPVHDETFTALRGQGAFLNGHTPSTRARRLTAPRPL